MEIERKLRRVKEINYEPVLLPPEVGEKLASASAEGSELTSFNDTPPITCNTARLCLAKGRLF